MRPLPNILLHAGQGDASFLIDGYKMPPGAYITPDFTIEPLGPGVNGVTVTFIAGEVTVLGTVALNEGVEL